MSRSSSTIKSDFSSGYSCQNADPLAIVGFCCSLGKPSSLIRGRGKSLYTLEVDERNRPLPAKAIRRPSDLFNIEQWRPELRLVGKFILYLIHRK